MNSCSIEMFGLSGAGKSTFQSKCFNDTKLLISGPLKVGRALAYLFTIILLIKMFITSPLSLIGILKEQQGRRLLLKLGFRYCGIVLRKNKLKNKYFFLQDSGTLMPIVSSIIKNNWNLDFKKLELILKSIPISNKIVYLSVPAEIAYKRYTQRESNINANIESFHNANNICNFIYQFLKFNNKEIILIDNSESLPSCSSMKKILKVKI